MHLKFVVLLTEQYIDIIYRFKDLDVNSQMYYESACERRQFFTSIIHGCVYVINMQAQII